jgi:hypothetical protein
MMMITLPGLPMFGHGQIDSPKNTEWSTVMPMDKQPDRDLVQRHGGNRHSSNGVLICRCEKFLLYDFFTRSYVSENVFAYSNRAENRYW